MSPATQALLRRWLPFALLAAWNGYCAFAHDPSRHELQALLIARASSGPLALFHNLGHEGHPGLWHLLLWTAVRCYDDPLVLNLLQALVAVASLAFIWFASPFRVIEKTLLSLSYHLAFDYTITAPGYGLGVALFFAFVALRRTAWAWLALGLMANVGIHFIALAAVFGALLIYRGQRSRIGIALCLVLVALAVTTAFPTPDTIVATQPGGAVLRGVLSLARLSNALVPMDLGWPFGFHWSQACSGCGGLVPLALGVLVLALGIASLGDAPALCATFAAAAAVLFLIGAVVYLGYERHYGLAFVTLIGMHWIAREESPLSTPSAAFTCWIIVSAAIGIWATYGALHSYGSNGRAAARWLTVHAARDAVVAAYPGWMGIEIAAYLRKEVYNLQAQRYQSFVVWNYPADARPRSGDLLAWLEAAPRTGPLYLVADADPLASTLDGGEIQHLRTSGVQLDETERSQAGDGGGYVVYRVRREVP